MLSSLNPRIDYDPQFDVLYYAFGDTSNAYGDEDIDNIVVLKDFDTDKTVGYTIMNFKRICNEQSKTYDILKDLLDISKVYNVCGLK